MSESLKDTVILQRRTGKNISKVSPTTKWPYLKYLKTRAQKAHWFIEKFGLKILNLEVRQNDGVCQKLNLKEKESDSVVSAATGKQFSILLVRGSKI